MSIIKIPDHRSSLRHHRFRGGRIKATGCHCHRECIPPTAIPDRRQTLVRSNRQGSSSVLPARPHHPLHYRQISRRNPDQRARPIHSVPRRSLLQPSSTRHFTSVQIHASSGQNPSEPDQQGPHITKHSHLHSNRYLQDHRDASTLLESIFGFAYR